MNKKIIIGVFLVMLSVPLVWGCDLHNTFLGINPNYNQSMIGFRYRYRFFTGAHVHANHTHSGEGHDHGDVSGDFRELYHTWEMWGRWYPNPKLQLIFSLPYSYNLESSDGVVGESVAGIGDLSLMARYQVFNVFPRTNGGWEHRMFAGGGVKLPSGAFRKESAEGDVNPLIQTGTGSVDFLASLTYLVKVKKFGLSNDVVYRHNTTNWNGYRFANRVNLSSSLFYTLNAGDFSIFPNAGVYLETAEMDLDGAAYQVNTGGMVLFDSFGADVYYKNLSVNLAVQMPLMENLKGTQGENGMRISGGVNIAF